ncbi:MAG TPA: alpha-ketoacid dehydrogenase subunit beta [Gemmatales bacterium]|nr:alpha-ketoacid dehydrogenase subunit beta [Gemmatales bacterium]
MPKLNMVKAINLALHEEMARDPSVVILGEDVGRVGGVFRVTEGLFEKFGAQRVIDTPVSEAGIVGCAIGMAINGLRPIAEIQFSGFMFNAFHQLNCHAARFRYRSWGHYPVPMVMRAPIGGGIRALEHHNDSEEALYVQSPGLKAVYPSTPAAAHGLLLSAIRDSDPVMYLEPKRVYRAPVEEVPEGGDAWPIGKGRIVRPGKHITLVTWGAMLQETLEAAEKADQELKIACEVIDLLSIVPMDTPLIVESVSRTGRCVIVHEAQAACGVGAEISARLNEQALLRLEAPVARVTGWDIPYPFFAREHGFLPNVPRILKAIDQTMAF